MNKASGFLTNLSEEEEHAVVSLVRENRNKNKPIGTKSLMAYACSINNTLGLKNLNAQQKWVYRFIKRYGMSIRRIAHMGQKLPDNKIVIINKFKEDIINKRKEMDILEDEDYWVINIDETAIFLEMGFNTKIDFRGNKNIDIDTTGKENYKLTVLLTVCEDGTKLAPLIILKGEPGKTIEINMRKLSFVKNNNIYIL